MILGVNWAQLGGSYLECPFSGSQIVCGAGSSADSLLTCPEVDADSAAASAGPVDQNTFMWF